MDELYSLGIIQSMEIIDISSGAKLGFLRDMKIDCEEQRIISILIPIEKNGWLKKASFIEIPWNNIVKIGIDVILVENVELESIDI